MAAWGSGIAMAVGGGVIMALSAAVRRRGWPFRVWPALYACLAAIPVVVALVVLLVVTNLQDGVVYQQTWLPLVNPLEEGAAFALLGLVVFLSGSGSLLSGIACAVPTVARCCADGAWLLVAQRRVAARAGVVRRGGLELGVAVAFAAYPDHLCPVLDVLRAGGHDPRHPSGLPSAVAWRCGAAGGW